MTTPNWNERTGRSASAEIEVPVSPEEAWQAIATGPGISAWFVPTEVAEGEGGTIRQRHGFGNEWDELVAEIVAWDPPHRIEYFVEGFQPEPSMAPARLATEFLVEARSGGTCVVRVVTSGFPDGSDWDRVLESTDAGWASAMESLRVYLTRFAGRHGASIAVGGAVAGSHADGWLELTRALGLGDLEEGEHVATSAPGGPSFAGVVEGVRGGQALLSIDEPTSGLAYIGAGGPGETTLTFIRAAFYGEDAPALAARLEPEWQAWMSERFPMEAA